MFEIKLLVLVTMLCLFIMGCGRDTPTSTFDGEETPEDPTLSMARTDWRPASKPAQLGDNYVSGKLLWHTPRDLYSVEDVWDRESAQGEGAVRTFRMIFRPRHFETDTSIANDQLVVDTIATGLKSWAGITSYLGNSGYYIHDTTQYFELRARGRRGRMHIEFGRISEDINGDGWAMSEDGIHNGARNGGCEEEEDVGLDGLFDQDERFYDPVSNPDPNGDNWYFLGDGKCPLPPDQCDYIEWDDESIRYEWLNGTEGNRNDPSALGRPDAEALRNGLRTSNSYFSFVVDFESDSFRVLDSNWPPGAGEDSQWWTYRIPIRDTTAMDAIVGEGDLLSWSPITHARIWFEDESTNSNIWDTVEVAQWGFLQTGIGPGPGPDSSMSFVRDYEYARGRVFDLGYPGEFDADDKIVNLIVYEEMRIPVDTAVADGRATFSVDPSRPDFHFEETISGIYVKQVDPSTYMWCDDPNRNLHYVVFSSEKGRSLALGAFMQVQKGNDTLTIGDLTADDSLSLRILRHNNPVPTHYSWTLMWRNCYNTPRGMALEDLNIKVFKGLPGSESTENALDHQVAGGLTQSYLMILGLDQYNPCGHKYPDGHIDDRAEIYRPDWGLLIFPNREPFNSSSGFTDVAGNETMALLDTVPEIYNCFSQQAIDASLYYIRTVTYRPPWRHY